jgi:hypothetical protein
MAAKVAGTWMALDKIGMNPDSTVGTTLLYPLGTRVKARDMGSTAYGDGEFIYATGVASTVRGSVVIITGLYLTTLVVARSKGTVGVALGACVASNYGWYQIAGTGVADSTASISAAGVQMYSVNATPGRIDEAAIAGDAISGMTSASTDDTNTVLVTMNYPSMSDFDNA